MVKSPIHARCLSVMRAINTGNACWYLAPSMYEKCTCTYWIICCRRSSPSTGSHDTCLVCPKSLSVQCHRRRPLLVVSPVNLASRVIFAFFFAAPFRTSYYLYIALSIGFLTTPNPFFDRYVLFVARNEPQTLKTDSIPFLRMYPTYVCKSC